MPDNKLVVKIMLAKLQIYGLATALMLASSLLHGQNPTLDSGAARDSPSPDSVTSLHPRNRYIIGEITIHGNRITKDYIIRRELFFP